MILEKGDMWDVFNNTDHFIITTNPILRMDGACVMGRGIAKQFATGASYGINPAWIKGFVANSVGTQTAYASMTASVTNYRK